MQRRQLLQGIGALAFGAGGVRAHNTPVSASAQISPQGHRFIHINGARLHYSIAGEHNAHPMIVLHGGRGQGQHGSVFAVHQPLSDRYRVIGFDMRGHGHSSLTPPYTFDQIVEDIEQLRQTLGGGHKMVLSGGSFGGFIALSYAVKYPQHLSHLILRGTAPSYRHEIEAIGNFQARATRKAPSATRAMLDKLFSPGIADDEEFRLIMFALAPMYLPDGVSPDYDVILESTRKGIYRARVHNDLYRPEVWQRYDVLDQLHKIPVPTLVICGESDWICDPAQSRLIAAKIPRARLVIVPGVDHSVPAEILLRETRTLLLDN